VLCWVIIGQNSNSGSGIVLSNFRNPRYVFSSETGCIRVWSDDVDWPKSGADCSDGEDPQIKNVPKIVKK